MIKKRGYSRTIEIEKNKGTKNSPTEVMPDPEEVIVLVPQFEGDVCDLTVEEGSYVAKGQKVADSIDSIPVHSSVSGTVKEISEIRIWEKDRRKAIRIVSDGKNKIWGKISPPQIETKRKFIGCIRRGGILNGGKPAYQDLKKKGIKEIYVSAIECEPVVTSGYRTLMEDTEYLFEGINLCKKFLEIEKTYICISQREGEAIDKLAEIIHGDMETNKGVFVKIMEDKYIPDDEKIFRMALCGKKEEEQEAFVFTDVYTMSQIGRCIKTGMPVISQKITVDGNIVKKAKNVEVPLGTKIADIIDFCGGYTAIPRKIINDGTMKGRCFSSDSLPITKETNAIVAFEGKESVLPNARNCIKCGACYKGCTKKLLPVYIAKAYEKRNIDQLRILKADECIQCRCCTYICPAKIPLEKICNKAKALLEEVKADE